MKSLSCVRPSATPWTAAYQAPLSMGFSRQEYWSGVPVHYLNFKLDLQEDDFIEILAMQHKEFTNEDLMELEAQTQDKERQEEEVTKQIHDTGNGKIFWI